MPCSPVRGAWSSASPAARIHSPSCTRSPSSEDTMEELLEKVAVTISRHAMLPREGCVVIGVSGGADSLALLHALSLLRGYHGRVAGKGRRDDLASCHAPP